MFFDHSRSMPKGKKKKDAGPPKPKIPPEVMADIDALSVDHIPYATRAEMCQRLGTFASAADVQRNDLGAAPGCIGSLVTLLAQFKAPAESLASSASAATSRQACEEWASPQSPGVSG